MFVRPPQEHLSCTACHRTCYELPPIHTSTTVAKWTYWKSMPPVTPIHLDLITYLLKSRGSLTNAPRWSMQGKNNILYLKEPVKSETRGHNKVWAKTFAPRLVSLRRKSQPWTPPPLTYRVPVTISAFVSSCFLFVPRFVTIRQDVGTETPLTIKGY